MDSNTKIVLDIFTKLIRNIKINNTVNSDLLRVLITNSFVRADLEEILDMMDLTLFVTEKEGAFVSAKPNNTVFGFKNEELRNNLTLRNNTELYLVYFIIFTMISTFYVQSNYRTQVEYITTKSLLDKVEEKLKPLSDGCKIPSEYEASFKKLYSTWDGVAETLRKDKDIVNYDEKRGQSKISFINRTLDFLIKQGLVTKDSQTSRYYITGKFEGMIEQFFDDSNTNTVLMDLLNEQIEREGFNNA
ncbi:DUF6063 family protein [Clostridium sp.]|uniref:DUF6063 family protein n=1 Tax=Clostridium sp. TaxID=1506 RepID=UPI002906FD0A|nr:DUF6063 family protein [Clostridium sp.]MDU5107840.1 DUF6063 family protein [Clostridium sp.]